jgi:hypothetical protein
MAQDTSMAQDDQESQDVLIMHEARVDVKKLSQLFQGHFNPSKAICSECKPAACGRVLEASRVP